MASLAAPASSRNRALRAVFLSHHAPWSTTSGGRLRDAQLLPLVMAGAEIDFVAVTRTYASDDAACRELCPPNLKLYLFADRSEPGAGPARESEEARRALNHLAQTRSLDVIHIEGHYLLHLVPTSLRTRVVIVEHNVESELLAQRAALESLSVTPSDLSRLRRQEEEAWKAAAAVVALTPADAAHIRRRVPSAHVYVIPNGWDHLPLRPPRSADLGKDPIRAPRILFLANYAYYPSADGLKWLLDQIFPRIQCRLPAARLIVAGAHSDRVLAEMACLPPGVEAVGWVPSVTNTLDSADLVLCPLRIGGGIKVKVTEALRRGCVVVSTSVGAQGLPSEFNAAIEIADDPEEYSGRVVALCSDAQRRLKLQQRLAQVQHLMPTWRDAAGELLALWRRLASISRSVEVGCPHLPSGSLS